MDEILKCDHHSNESYYSEQYNTVYYAVQNGFNFDMADEILMCKTITIQMKAIEQYNYMYFPVQVLFCIVQELLLSLESVN